MRNATIHRAVLVPAVAVLVAVAVAGAGCTRQGEAKVTSAWPVANSERVVPKPPVPPKWPLTGLKAPSEAATKRRVISVKIENSSAARPQTGLNSADVVYESVTEGGITRFNALFQSKDPAVVGPVRSARLSDLWIVPQYDALFFYSGASSTINGRVNGMGLANLSQDNGVFAPYFRSSSRSAPHNLYLRMKAARAEGKKRGLTSTGKVTPMKFSKSVEGSDSVSQVTIPLSDEQTTKWVYRASSHDYVRYDDGSRSIDAATGKQVRADNVVVLWARYKPFSRDKVGSTTYDITLGGDGRATLLRNGVKIDGTWSATREAPPVLTTDAGTAIKLAPGTTWFEVIDKKVNIRLK